MSEVPCRNLALEVSGVDDVIIHDAERTHPRRSKVERHRRTEPPRAHEKDTRSIEALLSLHSDLWKHEMASVAEDFVPGERLRDAHSSRRRAPVLRWGRARCGRHRPLHPRP